MPRKRHKPEEIVTKLRQVDVLVSQGRSVADAGRATPVTYLHWKQEYVVLKTDQVQRLKELEQESARLRKAVSDLTLDKCRAIGRAGRALGDAGEGEWVPKSKKAA